MKQFYLISFCLLVIVVAALILFSWSENAESDHPPRENQAGEQSHAGSADDHDPAQERTRIDNETTSTPSADTGHPGDSDNGTAVPLGWHVAGRVSSVGGDPVADARIALFYWGLPDARLKGTRVFTTTDPAGSFKAFVSIPDAVTSQAPSRAFPGLIAGRAEAPGFLAARSDSEGGISSTNHPSLFSPLITPPLPKEDAQSVRIDFVLKRGSAVRGRVVTTAGEPVEGARVDVKEPDRDWHFGAVTGEDGSYSIPIASSGEHLVSAKKEGTGVASAVSFSAIADGDFHVSDLVLIGSDSLAGLVTCPDGTPIEGIEIRADMKKPPVEEKEALSLEERRSRRRDASREDLIGNTSSHGITDQAGRFAIHGLHPGEYELAPRVPNDFFDMEEMWTSNCVQVHHTGTTDIRFVLPIYMIHARLLDEEGRNLPGMIIFEIGFSFGEISAGEAPVEETTTGSASIQVLPGTWTIWGYSNGRQPVKKSMIVGEKEYITEVGLVIPAIEFSGKLHLSVNGSDGRAIDSIKLSLYEESARSEAGEHFGNIFPLLKESLSSGTGKYEFSAPPGSYRLSLAPRGSSFIEGVVYPFTLYHSVSIDSVMIEPDSVTELPVILKQGGLMRLTPHFDRQGTRSFIVDVKVIDEMKEQTVRGMRFSAPGGASRIPRHQMESGVPYVAVNLLRPGYHILQVGARGYPKSFKTIEIPFTIVPGKVTDVEAWIEEE